MIAPLHRPPATGPTETSLRWAELAQRLGRCEARLNEELSQHLGPLELTGVQFSLLWACRQAPPEGLSQTELSAALGLSPAHVSGQVEQLRARGMLVGQRKAPDRRRQLWQLTEAGEARLETLLASLMDWAGQVEASLTPQRRQALFSLLGELSAVLDAASPGGTQSKAG